MNATLITFLVSGFGIVGLMAFKYFELATGKKTVVTHVSSYTNDHVRGVAATVRMVNPENVIRLAGWVFAHSILLVKKLFIFIQKKLHSQKIVNMVSGKDAKQNKGGASVFLKRIKDHDRVDSL